MSFINYICQKNFRLTILHLLTFIMASFSSSLNAASWIKTDEIVEYDGIVWNKVYIDIAKMRVTALLPEEGAYSITATPMTTLPKNASEFLYLMELSKIQLKELFDFDCNIKLLNPKPFSAKYAADLIPVNSQDYKIYTRILVAKDQGITLVSDDTSEVRRSFFFDSVKIHSKKNKKNNNGGKRERLRSRNLRLIDNDPASCATSQYTAILEALSLEIISELSGKKDSR